MTVLWYNVSTYKPKEVNFVKKQKYYNITYPLSNKNLIDFIPTVFGEERCKPNHSFGPAPRGHYLIHYVVSGCGTLYLDKKEYRIKENQAFLIKPDDLAKYVADEKNPWYYIWVGFLGNKAKDFDSLKFPIIDVKTELFWQMRQIYYLNNTKEEFIAGKLFSYHSLLFDVEKESDHISKVMNYIDAYYSTSDCTVTKIADTINLEKHYLARIFKSKTKKTVKEYIVEKRMENALKLLKKGYSVEFVSQTCGYSDRFSFSKAFKLYYGTTPVKIKSHNI